MTKELTKKTFGLLTAKEIVGKSKRGALWRCECACGDEQIVPAMYLINQYKGEDFNEFYCLINGMELWDMDRIIYPVCKLCRDHERTGFIEGIKVGVLLQAELTEE